MSWITVKKPGFKSRSGSLNKALCLAKDQFSQQQPGGDDPRLRCPWNSMQSVARLLQHGTFWANADFLPDSALLHVLPRTPGAAGAVKEFVFLGGREETTTYLRLKTYFVVSLVIYRTLTFSSPCTSSPMHFPHFFHLPLQTSLLEGPGCL